MSLALWIILTLMLGSAIAVLFAVVKARFASFTAQRVDDYPETGPQFDIREVLNGPIACEGVIFGPLGRVTSRFVADFDASWEGESGVMTEHFRYDSGNEQHREWRLTRSDHGVIRAEADDIVGAGSGRQRGSVVNLNYRIKLTEDAGGHVLDTTDWMYLMPDGTIINRSQFRKFGITVAELVATLRPRGAAKTD